MYMPLDSTDIGWLHDRIDQLRRERDDAVRYFAAAIIANGGRLEIPNAAITHAVLKYKSLALTNTHGVDNEIFIIEDASQWASHD